LEPRTSCDAETVGLWGAIHKRLWEAKASYDDLEEAVRAYARGYFIKNDYYNGINFAFLLNVRAANTTDQEEALADRILARRIRREVIALCDQALAAQSLKPDDAFWISASKAEALLGLGETDQSTRLVEQLVGANPAPDPWMVSTMQAQLEKLARLNP
jgi:hypothetical protein